MTVASAHDLSGSAEYWPSLGSRGDRAAFSLTFPRDSAVLVAGAPGAGKTTLLRQVAGARAERLDSEDIYAHPPHLLVLDVPPEVARAGQLARKRSVRDAVFDRHIARLRALLAEPAGIAERDGFASVTLLSRDEANRLTALRFAT